MVRPRIDPETGKVLGELPKTEKAKEEKPKKGGKKKGG